MSLHDRVFMEAKAKGATGPKAKWYQDRSEVRRKESTHPETLKPGEQKKYRTAYSEFPHWTGPHHQKDPDHHRGRILPQTLKHIEKGRNGKSPDRGFSMTKARYLRRKSATAGIDIATKQFHRARQEKDIARSNAGLAPQENGGQKWA